MVIANPSIALMAISRWKLSIILCAGICTLSVSAAAEAEGRVSVAPVGIFSLQREMSGEGAGIWCNHPGNDGTLLGVITVQTPEQMVKTYRGLYEPSQNILVQTSSDGGSTWLPRLRSTTVGFEIDPACAVGPFRRAYVAAMGWMGGNMRGFNLWHSKDNGTRWSQPIFIDYPEWYDRPHLAVDNSISSALRGRVYVAGSTQSLAPAITAPFWAGRTRGRIVVHVFDADGNLLFGPTHVETSVGVRNGGIHLGQSAVFSEGTYIVAWSEGELPMEGTYGMFGPLSGSRAKVAGRLRFDVRTARSTDGGRTFQPSVKVAQASWGDVVGDSFVASGKWYPAIAVGRQGKRDAEVAYLAWAQMLNGRSQILISQSRDRGMTWTPPTIVAPTPPFSEGNHHDGPHRDQVSVAISEGMLGASFYETDRPNSGLYWPVFTSSRDGGITWSEPVRVSDSPIRVSDIEAVSQQASSGDRAIANSDSLPPPRMFGRHPACRWELVPTKGGFMMFPLTTVEGGWQTTAVKIQIAQQ